MLSVRQWQLLHVFSLTRMGDSMCQNTSYEQQRLLWGKVRQQPAAVTAARIAVTSLSGFNVSQG